MKRIDLVGQKVGMLSVDEWVKGKQGSRGYYICSCECGGSRQCGSGTLLRLRSSRLIISCGCVPFSGENSPVAKSVKEKEGDDKKPKNRVGVSSMPEYKAWAGMLQRCGSPGNQGYAQYGGRGITVCDRWKESFEDFYADMGKKPNSQYSLDRINVDGNYKPSNCRWATNKQQARNRTNNALATYKRETKCMSEWAEISGIKLQTIYSRIYVLGWSLEKALETPPRTQKNRFFNLNGEVKSAPDWARETGIPKATILGRIDKHGWSVEKALTTPVRKRKPTP